MTEDEQLKRLEMSGALDLLRWAGPVVFARVRQDYDEAAGHDRAIAGSLAYKYFLDLFDLATSSGRFRIAKDSTEDAGMDILRAGIPEQAFNAMPRFDHGSARRADCNGSPAWAFGNVRWVLQSYPFGEIDEVQWLEKSPTKQTLAKSAPSATAEELYGWTDLDFDETSPTRVDAFEGETLVMAHAYDAETGSFEVHIGRSRLSKAIGMPWLWRTLVISGGTYAGTTSIPSSSRVLPGTPPTRQVEDAAVRLRPIAGKVELATDGRQA